jgi:hypothetical protein
VQARAFTQISPRIVSISRRGPPVIRSLTNPGFSTSSFRNGSYLLGGHAGLIRCSILSPLHESALGTLHHARSCCTTEHGEAPRVNFYRAHHLLCPSILGSQLLASFLLFTDFIEYFQFIIVSRLLAFVHVSLDPSIQSPSRRHSCGPLYAAPNNPPRTSSSARASADWDE